MSCTDAGPSNHERLGEPMMDKHISADGLRGKVIDGHSHVGLSLKSYACREYPYAQTIEGLYYRQLAGGVDANVVFPASGSLFFDPAGFTTGELRPAAKPLSPAPYALENEMLMLEVFEFAGEHRDRFIPFVMVDPARQIDSQLRCLRELEHRFPIYGIKVSAVDCQSPVTSLLDEGRPLLDYAAQRDLPVLLHTTVDPAEQYSHAAMCFQVIEKNPHLRFCLAHCIGFHTGFLQRAHERPNVWVDTAALTIQVQCARDDHPIAAPPGERLQSDYSDPAEVLRTLMARFPDTMVWGTDSPWYTFIARRMQSQSTRREFRLKARYEDEKAALDRLPQDLRPKACNTNTLRFLFGT